MTSLKKIFTLGCVINTLLMTGFYMLAAFLPGLGLVPSLSTMLTVLALSFVVAAAEGILHAGFSPAGRVALHYVLCCGSFLAFYIIANGSRVRAAQIIIAAVFASFIYAVLGGVRLALHSRAAKRENESLEYTPSFKR